MREYSTIFRKNYTMLVAVFGAGFAFEVYGFLAAAAVSKA